MWDGTQRIEVPADALGVGKKGDTREPLLVDGPCHLALQRWREEREQIFRRRGDLQVARLVQVLA